MASSPRIVLLLATTLLLAAVAPVHAGASGADLQRWCADAAQQPRREDAEPCTAYLQGFLEGADAAAAMAAAQVADAGKESFSDRATRTRLTPEQLRRARTPLESYCLADDTGTAEVVGRIARAIAASSDAGQLSAEEIAHRALVQQYPCVR